MNGMENESNASYNGNSLMKRFLEKDWNLHDGYFGKVILISSSYKPPLPNDSSGVLEEWRCGYVRLPKDHPFSKAYYVDAKQFYDDPILQTISVHGGLTYDQKDEEGFVWLGFDCAHYGDDRKKQTLEFCVKECESLKEQLRAFE